MLLSGHAAYSRAVKVAEDGRAIAGSYFMTYHTVLKTSQDYTNALRNARSIAQNVTRTIDQPGVTVFAYRCCVVFLKLILFIIRDVPVLIFTVFRFRLFKNRFLGFGFAFGFN